MSSDEEDACAATVLAAALVKERKPKRKRKEWVQDWLLETEAKGSYRGLFAELVLQSKTFKQYLKVPLPTCQFLLAKVRPWIERQDTHLRAAITVGAR